MKSPEIGSFIEYLTEEIVDNGKIKIITKVSRIINIKEGKFYNIYVLENGDSTTELAIQNIIRSKYELEKNKLEI